MSRARHAFDARCGLDLRAGPGGGRIDSPTCEHLRLRIADRGSLSLTVTLSVTATPDDVT
jgi:hypothetical protein